MSLLSPWALAALAVLIPLVILHARRRHHRPTEVSSLLLWQELIDEAQPRRLRTLRPALPLLLALQALVVVALVLALARPNASSSSSGQATSRTYVIDDSLAMTADDVRPNRLAGAKRVVARDLAAAPHDSLIRIIAAGAQPRLVIATTDRARALSALAALKPSESAPDLTTALRLADSLAGRHHPRVLVLRAAGDPAPRVAGVSDEVVGTDDDQAIVGPSARCGPAAGAPCSVFAMLRNGASTAVREDLEVLDAHGTRLAERRVTLPASKSVGTSFTVPASLGSVELRLRGADTIAADASAWVTLPSPPSVKVALIGSSAAVAPLQQALQATPGVTVRVQPPGSRADALLAESNLDLAVLVGWVPRRLPSTPALLLVSPPRLPDGRVSGWLPEAPVSTLDNASPLLAGTQLGALVVPDHTARRLTLPPTLAPDVSAPQGPLLATGQLAGQRVAVLAFNPAATALPQLDSFPILIDNLVDWSQQWIPASVSAGTATTVDVPAGTNYLAINPEPGTSAAPQRPHLTGAGTIAVTIPHPGLYTATETGDYGIRSRTFAVDANISAPPALASAPVPPPGRGAPSTVSSLTALWPWLGLLAFVGIALEAAYVVNRGRRRPA